MKRCAVPDCNNATGTELLMCLPHWRLVPRANQDEVWRTWREYLDGAGDPIVSFAAYKSAVRAAVESVSSTSGNRL